MIFIQLKIDNFYMFKDTVVDFTYQKKIKNSTIKSEYLQDFPNIKYKKVCIFMGANASGKTSLGRIMCSINNYLVGNAVEGAVEAIHDKNKNASIELVYITPETKKIHKLTARFNKDGLIFEQYQVCTLKKTYSLEKTVIEVENVAAEFMYDTKNNHNIENPGFKSVAYLTGNLTNTHPSNWNYSYSDFNNTSKLFKNTDITLLKKILQSFDSSIDRVASIIESDNKAHIIKFSNGDNVIIEGGNISQPQRLSRGTIEAIEVANFINFLITTKDGTFFLDEKMAYAHSEIEIAMLNLIIEKLKDNSQFFYTSHNYDVLAMNLPTHSYIFMKKDEFVEVIHPEKLGYTKNDRSLLGFVKNDVFNTLPDTAKIEALLQ